jgi:hypothetical protein
MKKKPTTINKLIKKNNIKRYKKPYLSLSE